eukprot:9280185-Prorocentrum_lima.AAC.1
MTSSLVGSEMCIRDSGGGGGGAAPLRGGQHHRAAGGDGGDPDALLASRDPPHRGRRHAQEGEHAHREL